MEKVILTKEQAEAIEARPDKETAVRLHAENPKGWSQPANKSLNELSLDEFIRALYIGYEVEPEFNKGDFVVWHGLVVEIKHPQTNDHKDNGSCFFTLVRSDGSTYGNITRDEIRHATPSEIAEEKERRFWKRLDRSVNEFRKGDLILNTATGMYGEVMADEVENIQGVKGVQNHNGAILDKDFVVLLCPAENRLDREGVE